MVTGMCLDEPMNTNRTDWVVVENETGPAGEIIGPFDTEAEAAQFAAQWNQRLGMDRKVRPVADVPECVL
jgi:hypothetical protein